MGQEPVTRMRDACLLIRDNDPDAIQTSPMTSGKDATRHPLRRP